MRFAKGKISERIELRPLERPLETIAGIPWKRSRSFNRNDLSDLWQSFVIRQREGMAYAA